MIIKLMMTSNNFEKQQNTKVNIGKKHIKPKKPLLKLQAEQWCSLLRYALMKSKTTPDVQKNEEKAETKN